MDLKYELSQDREVVAVVIGNRLNARQQCTAVDHKPNTVGRAWELEPGPRGGADLPLRQPPPRRSEGDFGEGRGGGGDDDVDDDDSA